MKIIDAVWEKRNLGVSTQEVVIESADSVDDFLLMNKSLTARYLVLKIPANKAEMVNVAADEDFQFVECQFKMIERVSKLLPEVEKVLKRNTSFTVETDNSSKMFDYMASKINEGIFHTDRISMDPFFSEELANKRYANWLLDLKGNPNAQLQIMRKQGEIVAFNLNKHDGQTSYGLVGGIFKEYQKEPLGLYWGASIIKGVSTVCDVNSWEATVSSNNPGVVKIWNYFGMPISAISYIFVKHNKV